MTEYRLRKESGLSRASYFRAKGELEDAALLRRERRDGRSFFALAEIVPTAKSKSLKTETRKSQKRDSTVSNLRPAKRRRPRQRRTLRDSRQKTKRQSEEQSVVVRALLTQVSHYLGIRPETRQANEIAFAIVRGVRRNAAAHPLSRELQAAGIPISENQVTSLLQDAKALLDPATQAAVKIFGEVVEVRDT